MTKKKQTCPSVEKHEIEGCTIQIKKEGGVEQLLIDGIPKRYFKNESGYVLHDNIYEKPHKSLIEAVKVLVRSASKKTTSKTGGGK